MALWSVMMSYCYQTCACGEALPASKRDTGGKYAKLMRLFPGARTRPVSSVVTQRKIVLAFLVVVPRSKNIVAPRKKISQVIFKSAIGWLGAVMCMQSKEWCVLIERKGVTSYLCKGNCFLLLTENWDKSKHSLKERGDKPKMMGGQDCQDH